MVTHRKIEIWDTDVQWKQTDDGTTYVWQAGDLPPYPDRLSDKIVHWAQKTPDQIWMAEKDETGTWSSVTYAELLQKIRCIGQFLLDQGLSVERPLLILSENSIAHALMALGAQYAGIPSAAIAPAYSLLSSDYGKLKSIAAQITPGAIFAKSVGDFLPAIEAVFQKSTPVYGVDGEFNGINFAEILNTIPTNAVEIANTSTGPDTIAKFMFTSGTTGSPKAVIQTQRMLCSNMEMVRDCYAFFKSEPPVLVDWAPWNHVAAGNKVFNIAIYNGGTFYIDEGKPSPKGIAATIDNLKEISPTWYFNVPIGYEMLVAAMAKDTELAENFFKNLKLMMYAGAGMAAHTWSELKRISVDTLGKETLLATGLGATETAPFSLFCTEAQKMPGNVGIPSKGMVLKLVPTGGKLEAHVKGPNVTPGYWRNEMLSQKSFDNEGYYNLGDALRFADPNDPAKGFYFDGRTAENFKLNTGVWISVGSLRANLVDAMDGLIRDAVIAGEGQDTLGALLIPAYDKLRLLVPNSEAFSDIDLLAHEKIRDAITRRLTVFAANATGSSTRITRGLLLENALDPDKGEITDKGSINQRAVLDNRQDKVTLLFSDNDLVISVAQRKEKDET